MSHLYPTSEHTHAVSPHKGDSESLPISPPGGGASTFVRIFRGWVFKKLHRRPTESLLCITSPSLNLVASIFCFLIARRRRKRGLKITPPIRRRPPLRISHSQKRGCKIFLRPFRLKNEVSNSPAFPTPGVKTTRCLSFNPLAKRG